MEKQYIKVRGAAENNLKHLDVDIPRNELVVLTGLSGSGKSSLAFETIYAEGQRRYMESLSSYARQFLGQMDKPDVESITGLSPAISIDQKSTNHNPRSTVGTVTEIYDYLRLLYARVGIPHCPNCGREIRKQTVDEMVERLMSYPERTRMQILAPVVRGKKGRHEKLLEDARRRGFVRARVDGEVRDLDEEITLDKNIKHNIEIVVDRIAVREGIASRLNDSLETALGLADGLVMADVDGETLTFSEHFACPDCGISMEEIEPRSFSFNNPFGACPDCLGLGYTMKFARELIIDEDKSFMEGCILAPGWINSNKKDSFGYAVNKALADFYHIDMNAPFKELDPVFQQRFIFDGFPDSVKVHYKSQRGTGIYDVQFEGLIRNLERRYRESSQTFKAEYENYMRFAPCETCKGKRLKKTSLAVTVGGKNIYDLTDQPVGEVKQDLSALKLTPNERTIATPILREVNARLGFLMDVGLDYLSLSRAAGSLSGGESQRIRLATQVGSGLVGVSYILDEPSIGLHQRDNAKLLATLKHLRDLGNSVLVVEHDEETMWAADTIIDIGPGAGAHGGEVVAVGTAQDLINTKGSVTGDYLSGRKRIPIPLTRRKPTGWITVRGAAENNLKHIDVAFPTGIFTCVTGVSGSGKSSLVNEILYKNASRLLYRSKTEAGRCDGIDGLEQIDKVIAIDQSPIGRTPRSNPATYTGAFDLIRDLFAQTQDARARGYKKGRFSFNVKGGRCEACSGDGIIKIEMHFLADVYVPCEVCGGKRYNRETLEVRYRGKNIAEVLDMTVEEALPFFEHVPAIRQKIKMLHDVGLDYIKLGQPSTTLSGGEAQRIKLATELSRRDTGKTLYILDEPTTGLHFADVHKLTQILLKLASGGNTVVVIEHNLDVIKCADYIIDLGPEGGDGGGTLVAQGTPEEVAKVKESFTGQYIKQTLERRYLCEEEKEDE
ncbi:MAG: excinuclease ABC subunit UvrA [Lachnospiraceae bacterium]|nr:excinuclease ABC subunit UvrA [Lachnospiraceae bacterium]